MYVYVLCIGMYRVCVCIVYRHVPCMCMYCVQTCTVYVHVCKCVYVCVYIVHMYVRTYICTYSMYSMWIYLSMKPYIKGYGHAISNLLHGGLTANCVNKFNECVDAHLV